MSVTHAHPLNPAALAFVPSGIVLVRVRVRGDLPGAETAYRKAVQIDPRYADARINLGTILYKQKDFTGAEAEWRAAIGIDPNDSVSHGNLGMALEERGDLAGAEVEYRLAIEIDPGNEKANYCLGHLLDILDEIE